MSVIELCMLCSGERNLGIKCKSGSIMSICNKRVAEDEVQHLLPSDRTAEMH